MLITELWWGTVWDSAGSLKWYQKQFQQFNKVGNWVSVPRDISWLHLICQHRRSPRFPVLGVHRFVFHGVPWLVGAGCYLYFRKQFSAQPTLKTELPRPVHQCCRGKGLLWSSCTLVLKAEKLSNGRSTWGHIPDTIFWFSFTWNESDFHTWGLL